jgi:hypothetical protein
MPPNSMHLSKVYDPTARAYRVQYAIAKILRDRAANEGAFTNCFEMEDRDDVILAILRRGLKNPKLRIALETSHLVNLTDWLVLHPELSEAYRASEVRASGEWRSLQSANQRSSSIRATR